MNNRVKYYSINLAIFTVLAVLVLVFKEVFVNDLKYFIGGLMLLYSIAEFIRLFLFEKKKMLHDGKFYLALVELVIGTSLLVSPINYEAVCVVWATWSVMREAYEIKEIIVELKAITPRILSGIESIVCIIFSILLMIEPGEHHALMHMYLLFVELILVSLVPLLDEILLNKFYKRKPKEE